MKEEKLIFPNGGYKKLVSFKIAQLVYDLTVIFVQKYVDSHSRTCDQMIQAARSGVQNIAEGSAASATSKQTEIKLTNVAKASLEELVTDYDDYLRQHNVKILPASDLIIQEFRKLRVSTIDEFRNFVNQTGRCEDFFVKYPHWNRAAQLIITLINQAQYLLRLQIARLEKDMVEEGGFTERIYNVRRQYRKSNRSSDDF